MASRMLLLIGTKKGAFVLSGDPSRRKWEAAPPLCFGHVIHHFVQDPRAPKRMLIAAKTGHLGPTVYHSWDGGRKWKEATRPPAFLKAGEGERALAVGHVFWLTPGHVSQPGVWYAGTSPQGLFRTEDHGDTWESVEGFNKHPKRDAWCAAGQEGPPDGATMHSINIDPRDPAHMYLGMSSGGVFETTDGGNSWAPLNKGLAADFLPDPNAEYGHDPHCVRLHPLYPDRLYQQNHCGIYKMDRAEGKWDRIGLKMPKKIGDIGFPVVLHPRDPNIAWVFPMDGTTVWPRTSPGGKPAVYMTRNAGKSWIRLDQGFPTEQGWLTVFRQAMTADSGEPVGLYLGTTSGEIWASRDEGSSWKCVASHLPRIQSVETGVAVR
jgi:hypothetical protein